MGGINSVNSPTKKIDLFKQQKLYYFPLLTIYLNDGFRTNTEVGCRESGYVKTSRIDNENHIVFGDTIGHTNNPIRIDQVEYLDVSVILGLLLRNL